MSTLARLCSIPPIPGVQRVARFNVQSEQQEVPTHRAQVMLQWELGWSYAQHPDCLPCHRPKLLSPHGHQQQPGTRHTHEALGAQEACTLASATVQSMCMRGVNLEVPCDVLGEWFGIPGAAVLPQGPCTESESCNDATLKRALYVMKHNKPCSRLEVVGSPCRQSQSGKE